MRKILFAVGFSFFFFQSSSAQDPTPNPGFENWNFDTCVNVFEVPDNWDQLNCETNILSVLTCLKTTDAHSGSFAAKLITKIVFTDTANGIITTGHLVTVPPFGVDKGLPYSQRPDSIYGWFKYTPTPGDSLQIEFDLFDANRDTIGTVLFQEGDTISAYTRFSAPIVYYSAATPDTSLWIISSSNGFNSLPNSTLYIDDIGLVNSSGINELNMGDLISIMPNPATDFISLKNSKQLRGNLAFYNEEGRMMKQFLISNQSATLSIKDLPEGVYLLQLTDSKNNFLATGKILIQR